MHTSHCYTYRYTVCMTVCPGAVPRLQAALEQLFRHSGEAMGEIMELNMSLACVSVKHRPPGSVRQESYKLTLMPALTHDDMAALRSDLHFKDTGRAGVPGTFHRVTSTPTAIDEFRSASSPILSFRMGRDKASAECLDVAQQVAELALAAGDGSTKSTEERSIIVAGPPGAGKTTVLREIVRCKEPQPFARCTP